jgi:hypothetical protein
VSAGLGALCDDDLGAGRQRDVEMGKRLHLAEKKRARGFDLGSEGTRIASARSSSSGRLASDQVMNPQPMRWLPAAANWRRAIPDGHSRRQ